MMSKNLELFMGTVEVEMNNGISVLYMFTNKSIETVKYCVHLTCMNNFYLQRFENTCKSQKNSLRAALGKNHRKKYVVLFFMLY